jgi:hypothetical protein
MQTLQTPPRCARYADCWPLLRRMTLLRLDPDEIAEEEPLLFCDLGPSCMMCDSRQACEHDLADEAADLAWQNWRYYCPNATSLTVLSAVKDSRLRVGIYEHI